MIFKRIVLSLFILPYFICPPQVFAQAVSPKPKSEMLYQKVLSIAEKKSEIVAGKLPAGNLLIVKAEKNKAVKEELKKRMAKLDKATNAEVAEFKRELLKINEQELSQMSKELQGFVNALSDKEIHEMGQFLKKSKLYEEQGMEFASAYTATEKRNAFKRALQEDLSFLRSVYNKKIGKFSKDELKKDLQKNLEVFEREQSQKADNKKILQISLIVLAGVALATWGISSAVYGARLSRVRSDREAKLTELQNQLDAQYNAYKEQLTQQEMDFLKNNGYFRTICGNFNQPDSILCNRYDYKVFSGTKHCTIYCYKNIDTGKETLHESPVCTSAFIPSDCYDPQEYWDAYAVGEDDGYDDGYSDGQWDGDSDGEHDGRVHGEDDGYDDGYDSGYDDGYDDGYDSGASAASKNAPSFVPFRKSEAYLKGFRDGLEQYQILFLNF